MGPSTTYPESLPDIATLRRLTQSMAMLDAVLWPEWQGRYYSFNAHWGEGTQMASMRNGSGDEWFLLFDPACGAALKGFAHESPVAGDHDYVASVQTALPHDFSRFLREPAFSMSEATFCLWRRLADPGWQVVARTGENRTCDDGSAEMLRILDGDPHTYRAWAEDYYEREIFLSGVQAFYAHQPLSQVLAASLSHDADWAQVAADAAEIGYPCTGG